MKYKRVIVMILLAAVAVSMFALPAQAAAKPAFQWLVDFTKSVGEYDSASKVYAVSWDVRGGSNYDTTLVYDTNDGNLYCFYHFSTYYPDMYTVLKLRPSLSTPYQLIYDHQGYYGAEYSVNPATYTEETVLHYRRFFGDPDYKTHVDERANTDLGTMLESLSNLLYVFNSGYQLKDLGFESFTRHIFHVYSDPEMIDDFVCGGTTHYRRYCLVCGEIKEYGEYNDHIKGEFVYIIEPTCTEHGYGYNLCSRCGEKISNSYRHPQPLGHDWELAALTAPITGDEHVPGIYRCNRCGEEKTKEYCAADVFKDMPARGNWAHTPIDWAFANKITTGTSATRFSPEDGCTRGQVVTFLWRAAGCPKPEHKETSFTDVVPGSFYEKAVAWAVENKITKGTSATTFSPDATCTRGQIVTFLWRFRGSPEHETAESLFTDLEPHAFYLDAVSWAVQNNVTKGMSDTSFSPDTTCTRAQIVTFLYRTMGMV